MKTNLHPVELFRKSTWKRSVAKESSDPSQYAVLLWVVWVVLGRNFEHSWKCFLEFVDGRPDLFGDLGTYELLPLQD